MDPILDVRDLSIGFETRAGNVPAVSGLSARIMPGEALGLVGESGCGKSTVALGIMGDLGRNGRITGGQVLFRGRDLVGLPQRDLRRIRGREIAMVYQEPMASLNPAMTIGRQLMEVLLVHGRADRREAAARARAMLEAVRLPDPDRIMRAYPHQLSGGQQQRIVIAMALMAEPALLILDEPTTALDVTVEAGIVDLIRALAHRFGTALLFISHNLGLVMEVCDRIAVMYAGEVVEDGPVAEVFGAMRHPYTQGLMRAMPLPGTDKNARPLTPIPGYLPLPHERPAGCRFAPRCAHAVAGRCDAGPVAMRAAGPEHQSRCLRLDEIDWAAPPPPPAMAADTAPGDVILKARGVTKTYPVRSPGLLPRARGAIRANAGIDFDAREAETLAIVGESGCGKSTLARLLLGLETVTHGRILLGNEEIGQRPVASRSQALVAAMQMVFQNPFDTLNPSQSIGRQLMRALQKFGIGRNRAERRERLGALLDMVRLPRDFADRLPRQLSGGQKQRVGIARAFAGAPRVVVADEPVSALDVSVQAAVTDLLMDIQRRHRTTLIVISHDLGVVRYLADRVMVMYLGHVVEIGTTDQVFEPPYHPYTEALLSAQPIADPTVERTRIVLEGEVPSALDPPPGCPFQTRCPRKAAVPGDLCATALPPLRQMRDGHALRCHLDDRALAAMGPVIRQGAGRTGPRAP